MATAPEAVRDQLTVIAAAATADLLAEAQSAATEDRLSTLLEALPLVVPTYYDAAGLLAVSWYDELRDEANPSSVYAPNIIGDPATDWIERELAKFLATVDANAEEMLSRAVEETTWLAEKEIARGFRDTVQGNTRMDAEAIGWSRIARPGACKFCLMLADKGAVYRSEQTAIFAAHTNCYCAARPEFRNGEHGPEASAVQYVASSRRAKDERTQAKRNALVRAYLNENFPDAPG